MDTDTDVRVEWDAGDMLRIARHVSDPQQGLTYDECVVVAEEPGFSGGWDVYDARIPGGDGVSFYGLSVLYRIHTPRPGSR